MELTYTYIKPKTVATWSKLCTNTPRLKQFQFTQFQIEAILKT